jgi:hypothetical protein
MSAHRHTMMKSSSAALVLLVMKSSSAALVLLVMKSSSAALVLLALTVVGACSRSTRRPQSIPPPADVHAPTTAAARPGSTPGTVVRSWEYHYDRNALIASRIVGSKVLAVAEAGHVLRFDAQTLALTGEKLSSRSVVALGPAPDGGSLVGLASGQVARLDPDTLSIDPIATVPGEPMWIGAAHSKRQTIVVYGNRETGP